MKWMVFDIEGDQLDLDKVTTVHCLAIKEVYPDDMDTRLFVGPDVVAGLQILRTATRLIGHNILWYDLPVLQKLHGFQFEGEKVDTLILSRLSFPDRSRPFNYIGKAGPHALEVWGHRLGGKQKVAHEDWGTYSDAMGQRCMTDVDINWEVYKALWREMKE